MPSVPRGPAYAALVLTAALWGSSAVAARGLLDAIPPVALAYLRWTVVLLLLLPFAWPERAAIVATLRAHPRAYAALTLLGFFFLLGLVVLYFLPETKDAALPE